MKLLLSIFAFAISISAFAQPIEGTLLDSWKDSTILGTAAFDNAYNDVWGFKVNNHEYAVIGSTFGMHIIDVTDPRDIFEVERFQGKDFGDRIIHRDYHEYKGYIYAVSDEGQSSMQIIDISQLPDTVTMAYDSDSIFIQSHNIFIDTSHARLYSFLTSTPLERNTRGVVVYDISEPTNPKYIKHFGEFGILRPNHVHDGYIRDHIAFLNCGNDGFAIMDFTDLDNPQSLGVLNSNAYLQSGYNHSGWASDDCSFYYMADETWGTDIKAVDLSDKADMTVTNFFDAGNSSPNSITHNQVVACDYLYVSYYYDGLQVFDVSDASNPQRVMQFNTSSRSIQRNYEGAWGVYPHLPSGNILVSDMQEGLFVIEAIDSGCDPNANLKSCNAISSNDDLKKENANLHVFPNPIYDQLNFSISGISDLQNGTISILGVDGQLQLVIPNFELQQGKNSIPLAGNFQIPNGIYYLKINSENINGIQRFVIHQ